MTSSPLKNIAKNTLISFLPTYTGTPLPSTSSLPHGYALNNNKISKTYLYRDFKQAFGHFTLIAKQCHAMNYYPEIYNVYNRIAITIGTGSSIHSKDLYMSWLIDELHAESADKAHENTLQRLKYIL